MDNIYDYFGATEQESLNTADEKTVSTNEMQVYMQIPQTHKN